MISVSVSFIHSFCHSSMHNEFCGVRQIFIVLKRQNSLSYEHSKNGGSIRIEADHSLSERVWWDGEEAVGEKQESRGGVRTELDGKSGRWWEGRLKVRRPLHAHSEPHATWRAIQLCVQGLACEANSWNAVKSVAGIHSSAYS